MKKATSNELKSRLDKANFTTSSNNQTLLKVDEKQMELFFRVIFKNIKDGFVSLRGFKEDQTTAFKPQGYSLSDVGLLLALERLGNLSASMPGVVFCSPICTFICSDKATGKHISSGAAIIVDLDNVNPLKSRETLERILGKPTLVVASGGEWQDPDSTEPLPRLHLYWRLSIPTHTETNHERLKAVRKLAAGIVGADPTAASVVHPMRLPGSWHTKDSPKLCEILELNEGVEVSLEFAERALKKYEEKQKAFKADGQANYSHSDSWDNEQFTAYGKRALEEELLQLSAAVEGERNTCLNKTAFRLGQLVATKQLTEDYVFEKLMEVALRIGLAEGEASRTIKSGLSSGMSKPREIHGNANTPKEFIFIKISDLEASPPGWIVENYLEENTISEVFGDPGAGKTFLALDFAIHVALGKSWLGNEVNQGSVFYIAGEGFGGLTRRQRAWSLFNNQSLDDAPLFISQQPAMFMDKNSAMAVASSVDRLASIHGSPKLVVIDTLARNFGEGNENTASDMNMFIANLDICIRIPFGCCVLIVHHTGHADKTRGRGSTALKGALDSEYQVVKEKDKITVCATKMKDATLPDPLTFQLTEVGLGIFDKKNKEVTSAALKAVGVVEDDLERIRELIPNEGINQTNLSKTVNQVLNLSQKSLRGLLEKGLGKFWSVEEGDKNAKIYKPFFSN
ncbi:putative uncharacterized protein [Waddlia chondrophila 2032/99]|uniref:AAA+ ATPase domain-containing protein n=1 Tax=Waddlia chondrophila 2032/99 TaxID=765953 RepID=F8LCB4_9BACT|nr:putative uncharacterized protein [Waddlia chondrophila 2032/99]